jgi:hypothetical protein
MLSSVLAGDKSIDEIVINSREWYAEERDQPDHRRCRQKDRPRTPAP